MKKLKVSLILNVLIVILVITFSIFMFTGFQFMKAEVLLESTGIGKEEIEVVMVNSLGSEA